MATDRIQTSEGWVEPEGIPWLAGSQEDFADENWFEAVVIRCDDESTGVEAVRVVRLTEDVYLCNRHARRITLPGGQVVWNWAVEVVVRASHLPKHHQKALARRDGHPEGTPLWEKENTEAAGLSLLAELIAESEAAFNG